MTSKELIKEVSEMKQYEEFLLIFDLRQQDSIKYYDRTGNTYVKSNTIIRIDEDKIEEIENEN